MKIEQLVRKTRVGQDRFLYSPEGTDEERLNRAVEALHCPRYGETRIEMPPGAPASEEDFHSGARERKRWIGGA